MRFAVYLPTYAWPDLAPDQAAHVKHFARKAEDLGLDALWAGDHFMIAGHYGTAWMSPLLCLAHAASATSRIRLATGVLVLPALLSPGSRWPASFRRSTTSPVVGSSSASRSTTISNNSSWSPTRPFPASSPQPDL